MMKTKKQSCAVLTAALMAIFTSCTIDNEPLPAADPDSGGSAKSIILVSTPSDESAQTRIGYNDDELKLTWNTGDDLQVLIIKKDGSSTDRIYKYSGPDGATSGHFYNTASPYEGDYKEVIAKFPWIARMESDSRVPVYTMHGQVQNGNGDYAHLRNYILLEARNSDINQPFSMKMKSSIMKFILKGIPKTVGKLGSLIWTVETESGGKKSLPLNFPPGKVDFSQGDGTLTAYLAFMPEDMRVKADGNFTVTLVGETMMQLQKTVPGGKIYEEGTRYTATMGGGNDTWNAPASKFMSFNVKVGYTTDLNKVVLDNTFHIPFPISGYRTPKDNNITVEWGDGKTAHISGDTKLGKDDAFNHTYDAPGEYTITISASKGQIPPFNFFYFRGEDEQNFLKLISMNTPLLATNHPKFLGCFYDCENLISLPPGLFSNNPQITDFNGCFQMCFFLPEIPGDLFAYTPNVTTFEDCFSGCGCLRNIPAGLFDKNTKATNFKGCFRGCPEKIYLPPGLFAKTAGVDFTECFAGGHSFLPLHDNNFFSKTATNFTSCFSGNDIESIPPGFFDSYVNATTFMGCFRGCGRLKTLPQGLFQHNIKATDFSFCFSSCDELELNEEIFSSPQNLSRFINMDMNFNNCFQYVASDISEDSQHKFGTAPALWEYIKGTGIWSHSACFYKINKRLSNLDDIPSGWY